MLKTYEVRADVLQTKLLLPLLTPKAKMLVSCLSAADVSDITAEFKLTVAVTV